MMYGWMGAFGGVGMAMSMVIWLVVLVLLVWAVSSLFVRGDTDALEILKRRYAAGDITSAEYETARKALAA